MPHTLQDRPAPAPKNSKNIGFISQYVEIPRDVVFTVEYSVRAAMMAVYKLCDVKKKVIPIKRHDKNPVVLLKAVKKSYLAGDGNPKSKKCGLVKPVLKAGFVAGVAFGAKLLISNMK